MAMSELSAFVQFAAKNGPSARWVSPYRDPPGTHRTSLSALAFTNLVMTKRWSERRLR